MAGIKRNVKDSVFIKMFEDKKYLIQLYQSLHPEDYVTEDDLEIVSLESVLTNDAYNDLGFLVKNKLVILVEAQTTWSVNILIRMLIYLAKTYHKYIRSNKILTARLYSETKIILPSPELYIIYTGSQDNKKTDLSLKEEFFSDSSDFIDLKAKVIFADENRRDIIGQYIAFCVILKKQIEIHSGDKLKTIQETIRICIENNNLKEYLSNNMKEVENYMFALLNPEEATAAAVDYVRIKHLTSHIHDLKEFLPSFEEIYKRLSSNGDYSDFSEKDIKEIYDEC